MRLSTLLAALGLPRISGADPVIRHVTRDSREVRPDSAFVAIVGTTTDGHAHADCGAAVVFAERPVRTDAPVVLVPDTKAVLAHIAAELAGHPSRKLALVGVTGTNGKTTVTTLAEQMFTALGVPCGRIGTTGSSIQGALRPSRFTTPEAPILQPLLAEMVDRGVEVALLEVSSIGLAQRRVDGCRFALGVFTNLTRDHLDFHGTMEAYARAKARLFDQLREPGDGVRALLCADEPAHVRMGAPDDRWTYGFADRADLHIERLELGRDGMRVELRTPAGPVSIDSPLIGRHNAQNLVASFGIGLALGGSPHEVARALAEASGAPGRLERIPNRHDLLVVVDYAHTDDALRSVLPTLRELTRGTLWVVFGAGGDRDPGKRPSMGAVADALADRVVLTSDNPRSEDPAAILDAIQSGMTREPALVEPDREIAIRWTLRQARPGDAVLIAGKGHETTQEIDGVHHPFDDRDVARKALEAL